MRRTDRETRRGVALKWKRLGSWAWVLGLTLASPLLRAEGEQALRDTVTALARTSYSWEITARQNFRGEAVTPRLELSSTVEVRGKVDGKGMMELTRAPSREVPVPITIVSHDGDVVALTPDGWLRRSEVSQSRGPDGEVEFEGKRVRRSRVMAAALKAMAARPLSEELFDLVADLKSCRVEQGVIVAELRDAAVEKLWGDAQAKRAPEIQGTIIAKVAESGPMEFHVVLAIGFPNSRTKKVAWSMQQWTTRVTDLGSTRVEPAAGARAALAAGR